MIKVSDSEAKIIGHALTFFYKAVQRGDISLYGMKPYEISEVHRKINKRMDDEWNSHRN